MIFDHRKIWFFQQGVANNIKPPQKEASAKLWDSKSENQRMDQDRQSLKVDMRDLLDTGLLRTASMALILDDVDE